VIQSVLHLHVCADPAPAEYLTTVESAPTQSVADPVPVERAVAHLHYVADYATDYAAASAAPTETS
jgi:hypothetical protein